MNTAAAVCSSSDTSVHHKALRLQDLDISGQRVLVRSDMNVPLEDGQVVDDQRIRACLPTIEYILDQNAAVLLLSHLGRPQEGESAEQFSLKPVAERLSFLLGKPVRFSQDYLDRIDVEVGEILMCENVRFNVGEKSNDQTLARQYAGLGNSFVMDAFATAHRCHASTEGVIHYSDKACMGLLLERELEALSPVLELPKHPVVAIVGGAKISSKMSVLDSLIDKVNCLIVGGGIANVFLLAAGRRIGTSLYEPELVEPTRLLLDKMRQNQVDLILPEDVVCAQSPIEDAMTEVKSIANVRDDEMILDVGPITCLRIDQAVKNAETILWSGPMGVFEKSPFANGTHRLAMAIADSAAYSVAGGGDTVAAINQFDMADRVSYISTGGGAFLKCMEGQVLPAVHALEEKIA